MNRREFLSTSLAGLAYSAVGRRAFAAGREKPQRVGLIGCGWYGKTDLYALTQVAPVEVVSLCDVDAKMLAEAATRAAGWHPSGKTPRTYGDYREMLKEKDLDIVLIGTPDHWHALPMIAAVEAGADSGIVDPVTGKLDQVFSRDRTTVPYQLAEDMLLGKDLYCSNFLRAYRKGELKE